MVSFRQDSFAGGIISPQNYGHTSQTKYLTGLAESLNWQITRFATAENRAGTQYIGTIGQADYARLIPFVFNAGLSYLLEAGDNYIRVYRNGGRISVAGAAAYAGGTTYGIGDLVTSVGLVYYSRTAANTGNTPASNPTNWYLQANDLLEVPTNIAQGALSTLQYVQQNDIMTVVHQSVVPQQLQRYSNTKWAWVEFTQSTGIDAPTPVSVVAGVGPSPVPGVPGAVSAVGGLAAVHHDEYVVTAYESIATSGFDRQSARSAVMTATVGQATAAHPVTITWTSPAGTLGGYAVYKEVTPGFSTVFGLIAIVEVGTLSFVDDGVYCAPAVAVAPSASTGDILFTYVVTAVSSENGSESLASALAETIGKTPTDANPNVISWGAVANSSRYNIYRIVAGVPGFVGTVPTVTLSFNDNNIIPNTTIQPPSPLPLFTTSDDYPGSVGYYQQRLCFGNTVNQPQTVTASRVGNYYNFSVSIPVVDNDAVQFTIAGRQVQEIRAIIDLGKLILHTSGDEYVATGNQAGTLTPTGIGLVHQSSSGCAQLVPVVIGNIGIFVQSRGSFLRDLEYSIYTTSFKGRDLTKFAPHLFANRTIVDMCWQQVPNSIVWAVMSDGELLGLTYSKDDDIWAWHRHQSINGDVEAVCVVPEGTADTLYLSIRRVINGSTVRYIEKLAPREFTDITIDAIFTDSSLSYNGTNGTATTMLVTTGAGWTPQDNLTLTASAPFFVIGDVGNAIVLQLVVDGEITERVTLDIIGYTSVTVVTVQPDRTVPVWARSALTTWGKAVHSFSGLDHLEGQTIGGLGDGNVIAQKVVTAGAIDTAYNYVVLNAGLPITADLETLPIENTQGETIQNKKVVINETTPIFYSSRGGYYGQDFDTLKAIPARSNEPWNTPAYLQNGPYRIPVPGAWERSGKIAIRQSDPLPIGISGIVSTGSVAN